MYKVPLVVIFIACSILSAAQIPDNFEFLDHRVRLSYPGAAVPLGDKIYYVSHNNVNPFTTVNVVDSERNVETIFSLDWLFSESKIFKTSDTSAVVILDALIEYDILYPGFYMIQINQNKVEIDTLFTDYDQNNFDVIGSVIDSLGRAVFMKNGKVVRFDNGSLVDIAYTDKDVSLYHNVNYQLFGFDNRSIYIIEENKLTKLDSLDNYIVAIKSFEDENLILTRENLRESVVYGLEVYNIDFSEKIRSLDLPELSIYHNSLDHINYDGEKILLMSSNDGNLEIISIDTSGARTTIHVDEAKDEQFYKLFSLEDDRYLIGGVYGKNRFSKNIFFRNYSLTEENNYDKVNVALHDFELNRVFSDTISIESYPGTKTFHFGRHNFEMKLSIENQGSESISTVNVFSIDNLDNVHPKFHFDFELAGIISPSEIKDSIYEDSRYLDADVLRDSVNIPFFIPGADFKFNENPFWDLQVTVDVEDLILNSDFDVYPNPTFDLLNFELDDKIRSATIYNLNGQLLYHKVGKIDSKIDVSTLSSGTYLLKLEIDNRKGYMLSKFVKI